jgi:hypothetical protein
LSHEILVLDSQERSALADRPHIYGDCVDNVIRCAS